MPGLVELAYTTAGGAVGAVVTNYFAKHQERRQLRGTVMEALYTVAAVPGSVCALAPGAAPIPPVPGRPRSIAAELGLSVRLGEEASADSAFRKALATYMVAALAAGIPRVAMDFAAGAYERELECEVLRLIDAEAGNPLGAATAELLAACVSYRKSATGLLLALLWHPRRSRPRMRSRIRGLRAEVGSLGELQEAAYRRLLASERTAALAERLKSTTEPDT
ncbi:hypothetical protein ACFWY9_01040 [Amycolatopsis sp. NPDC059027]|uniref:hypothetical protein n=1 Tax=Amycolatopsis sp. NPDC059027 TaxID=3346709 RepID=UPI00366E8BD1